MEAFTGGRVSAAARKAYLADHPWVTAQQFTPCRGGYVMHAWESQIAMARAYGRGARSSVHPFDVRRSS